MGPAIERWISRVTIFAVVCGGWLALSATRALALHVDLPLNLDYPLLDAALRQRFAAEPGGPVQLWSGLGNCGHFYAIDPRFGRSESNVQLTGEGELEAAIGLSGQCLNAMSWRGNFVATTTPWITDFTLRFRITDLNFTGANGTALGGGAFGLAKTGLLDELGSFSYDLRPHLRQLQELADELPSTPASNEVRMVLASLRPAPQVVAQGDGIAVTLGLEVPESMVGPNTAPLTAPQKTAWRVAAENVSEFLTTIAAQARALMPDAQLGDEVARIAIDSHARLAAAADAPPAGGDPLPLFRDDWRRLRAALKSAARRGAMREQTAPVLAAVAAGDVVFALDERAPGLGTRISAAGLEPLVRGLPASPPRAPDRAEPER